VRTAARVIPEASSLRADQYGRHAPVDQALRDLSKREALQAYQQGRLTLRELARTLRLDVWAAQDLLAAEGVAVAQGGRGETAAALDGLLGARRDPAPALAPSPAQTPSAD